MKKTTKKNPYSSEALSEAIAAGMREALAEEKALEKRPKKYDPDKGEYVEDVIDDY